MADPNHLDPAAPKKKESVPYWRYAFHNLYNYTLMGGVAAASLFTGNWWLAVAGAGAEVLWMVFGPDSRLLQKGVFDKVHEAKLRAAAEAERNRILGALPEEDQARVMRLEQKRLDILRLAGENTSLSGEMLGRELTKLDQINASFVDLVCAARRYRDYFASVDFNQLEAQLERSHRTVEQTSDEQRRELAQKNLAVLEKRKEKLGEMRGFISRAAAQMDLIENTFKLLADQIVTMRSPSEMGSQLDELMDGVEAVQSTARETAAMLQSAEVAR
jgi:hypothetical protein